MERKIDVANVKPWLISWFLASLIYDEKRIAEYCTGVLRMKCHFHGTPDGAEFFGVVIDENTGTLYFPYRGTDGYDSKGNAVSWLHNFNILTGDDGVEDGFQLCGNMAFDMFKHYLYHMDRAIVQGHSKGGGVAPYLTCLCRENMPNLDTVHFDAFANPPTGNEIFGYRFAAHEHAGGTSGKRYWLHGDPITSPLLRGPAPPLNGVDVGELEMLPKLIRYKLGPAGAVNHSCTLYNAAIALKLCDDPTATQDDFMTVAFIHNHLLN